MDLNEIGSESVNWIHLAPNRTIVADACQGGIEIKKKEVNQSRYRPGGAKRVPGS